LLCLLAATFAVEAKIAWFGPDGSPAAQISASKLQLADAPKVAAQGHLPSFPSILFLQIAVVLALASTCRSATFPLRYTLEPIVPGSPGFFPSLFFRPPPGC
jgi:hypothetical protein